MARYVVNTLPSAPRQLYRQSLEDDPCGLESKTVPELEMELRAEAHSQWGEDPRVFYTLPAFEIARRVADCDKGDLSIGNFGVEGGAEPQAHWDARVFKARLIRQEPVGPYYEARASGGQRGDAADRTAPQDEARASGGQHWDAPQDSAVLGLRGIIR